MTSLFATDGDADSEALAQAMRNIDSVGQSEAAAKFKRKCKRL